jgi:hypothetical protein
VAGGCLSQIKLTFDLAQNFVVDPAFIAQPDGGAPLQAKKFPGHF